MSLDGLGCIASKNGVIAKIYRPHNYSLNNFRKDVKEVCSHGSQYQMIVNFHRAALN